MKCCEQRFDEDTVLCTLGLSCCARNEDLVTFLLESKKFVLRTI